ncbi:MAG: hypothetical protein ACJ708_07915, partial [Nitrososphaeraceae archaeon]
IALVMYLCCWLYGYSSFSICPSNPYLLWQLKLIVEKHLLDEEDIIMGVIMNGEIDMFDNMMSHIYSSVE